MKRLTLTASVFALAVALPGTAQALSHHEAVAYGRAYVHVEKVLGVKIAGCKLIGPRHTCRGRMTDARIRHSTDVLRRMFAPRRIAPRASAAIGRPIIRHGTMASTTYPQSSLASCIIRSESGGNSQAVNSSGHMGEGQWDESTWLADGGGRYASTPLGASASEQTAIINEQLAAGHAGQWTNYDPC